MPDRLLDALPEGEIATPFPMPEQGAMGRRGEILMLPDDLRPVLDAAETAAQLVVIGEAQQVR